MSDENKAKPVVDEAVPEDFLEGINDAIKETEENEHPLDERAKGDEDDPQGGRPEDDEDDEDDDDDLDDDDDSVTDEHIERGVRVGLSIEEAKVTPESVIERLEAANKAAGNESDEGIPGENDSSGEGDDLVSQIPDLDPEEYDEDVVKAFSALKEVAKELQSKINDLEKNGSSSGGDFFTNKLAELGKGYENLDRAKFDRHKETIAADAKDAGQELSDNELSEKAFESAFGDIIKGQRKSKASKRRSRKSVNRPRDTSGRFSSSDDRNNDVTEADREQDAINAVAALFEDDD